ncbi:MSMEG_0565 family glycosyltransferase [Bosea sp. LjRoot9]|uniref:MSMEG_0565 family glycosyltransferase n=1 Tax=Bosea sp. LjRoot9 TaxID=3342341 RepID=UPI003ECE918C
MRVAILAHSTNPRGGVVHALALGEALVRLGHEAVVHAPDAAGAGFFRETLCETVRVTATPANGGMTAMVEQRIADYVRYFEGPVHRRFDVFHAQDGISGNALATLKERGLIGDFAHTVHHIDDFADERLRMLQKRSIAAAGRHFAVSRTWCEKLRSAFGFEATIVGNGVDRSVFSPTADGGEAALRVRHDIGEGPVFLAIGGVEARKNTVRILQAFAQILVLHPSAQLVIAGGASLLDHRGYRQDFTEALAELALPPRAVIQTGPVSQDDMPRLYRLADSLVFPSVKEGFGLVVLEAMASGVPVVTARIAPFTEYLGDDDVAWCDPFNVASIANAMAAALSLPLRAGFIRNGAVVAAAHDWSIAAQAHLGVYESLKELVYA